MPAWNPPETPDAQPWWRRKRFIISAGIVAVLIIAAIADPSEEASDGAAGDPASPDEVSSSTEQPAGSPEYLQPVVEGEGDDGPFWGTTFGVIAPAGSWEEREAAGTTYCVLTGENDYRVVNDRGVTVAAFDHDGQVVFDRSGSAESTPEELFSGQDSEPDTTKPLLRN